MAALDGRALTKQKRGRKETPRNSFRNCSNLYIYLWAAVYLEYCRRTRHRSCDGQQATTGAILKFAPRASSYIGSFLKRFILSIRSNSWLGNCWIHALAQPAMNRRPVLSRPRRLNSSQVPSCTYNCRLCVFPEETKKKWHKETVDWYVALVGVQAGVCLCSRFPCCGRGTL